VDTLLKAKVMIEERLAELEPAVNEYLILVEKQEIIEAAFKEIERLKKKLAEVQRPPATKTNVNKWARALDPDEIVRAADLAAEFDQSRVWAERNLRRMVEEKIMEKWGRGQFRLVPDRAGEAKLHVVTA